MKTLLIVLIALFLFSCENEDSSNNTLFNEDWVLESLNSKYLIQFPKYYKGSGFNNNSFYKSNPENDIIVSHCNNNIGCYYVDDTLDYPLPENVMFLPTMWSCSFINLNNKEYFTDNNHTKGILYYFTGLGYLISKRQPFWSSKLPCCHAI